VPRNGLTRRALLAGGAALFSGACARAARSPVHGVGDAELARALAGQRSESASPGIAIGVVEGAASPRIAVAGVRRHGEPARTSPSPRRVAQLQALPGSPSEQRLAFVLDVLRSDAPLDPGTDPYSNAGHAAAAAMIEHAAGEPWETLVRTRIAEPLGMASVGFGWPTGPASTTAPHGHATDGGRLRVMPLDHPFLVPCLWPAGAVSCSIGDLARYARDHLHGLTGRVALLANESYRRLHRTFDGKPEGFTLGWGVRQSTSGAIHFGAGSGGWYFARVMIAPAGDVAAVAAANSGDAGAATRELCEELLARYGKAG
jgi:CubicO group peptidase (beta-lactamase class C family)